MLTAAVIGLLASPSSQGSAANGVSPFPFRLVAAESSERERVATGAPSSTSLRGATQSRSDSCPSARKALTFYRSRVEFWGAKMGATGSRSQRISTSPVVSGCPRYLSKVWRAKAHAARVAFERWFERTYGKWRCIHEHEGSWTDDNPPYWGGLQMTLWFQQTYGPEFYARWGTANRWPVWAQLLAAERAWRGSGFSQWGTRWMCGL